LAAGANCSLLRLDGATTVDWHIANLLLDGTKASNTYGHGIYLDLDTAGDCRGYIDHVMIQDCAEDGVYLPVNHDTRFIKFNNVQTRRCVGSGVYLDGGSDHYLTMCESNNNAKHGYYWRSGGTHMANCCASQNGTANQQIYYGFHAKAAQSSLVGCTALDNRWHGIYLDGHSIVVSGCVVETSGYQSTYGDPVGIYVNNTRAVITGIGAMTRRPRQPSDRSTD